MSKSEVEYNDYVEKLRESEYPMLKDAVYLDHAGCTLNAKSLLDAYTADLLSGLFGNPHSASSSSQSTTSRVDDARLSVLKFVKASPEDFDVIFVSNATAGIKLVMEAFRGRAEGFNYVYHQDSHTSLIGVRESARWSRCVDDRGLERWLFYCGLVFIGDGGEQATDTLFAYPAQSNFDGCRLRMDWLRKAKSIATSPPGTIYTLLDTAALASTSQLDLSNVNDSADFTVLSFSKIFGFPDLGALIVKTSAGDVFKERRYFGGGTVDMVTCGNEPTYAAKAKTIHDGLEDGTLPFHSIIALEHAFTTHKKLFGSMDRVAKHTSFLAKQLRDGLNILHHANGQPLCQIYSRDSRISDFEQHQGPVIAFNLKDHNGSWISNTDFGRLASVNKFHIRTGGLCNPGGIASSLGLEPCDLKQNYSAGYRCGAEMDILHGKPTGAIRVSLGAMSTMRDVEKFISFLSTAYVHYEPESRTPTSNIGVDGMTPSFVVQSLTIYPVKSCGGMSIPYATPWEVNPEGLAWDREWCIVHEGTSEALSQKKHHRMALIRPTLDFPAGLLRIRYIGAPLENHPQEISVPLALDHETVHSSSEVCGDNVQVSRYPDPLIASFFTGILKTQCTLARFPPGSSSRHSKPYLIESRQRQNAIDNLAIPGAISEDVPSAPESSTKTTEKQETPLSLSNESPILLLSVSSVSALNREISKTGGKESNPAVFRANIIVAPVTSPSSPSSPPYSSNATDGETQQVPYVEETWKTMKIGDRKYEMLGKCRRCNMVCVDQETGEVNKEPLGTLLKVRRNFFGMHMKCLFSCENKDGVLERKVLVKVGDVVEVESMRSD